jgi:hypothetical protein
MRLFALDGERRARLQVHLRCNKNVDLIAPLTLNAWTVYLGVCVSDLNDKGSPPSFRVA